MRVVVVNERTSGGFQVGSDAGIGRIDPPAYSPLDAYTYRDGVHLDLPAEVITAALERGAIPATAIATRRSLETRKWIILWIIVY